MIELTGLQKIVGQQVVLDIESLAVPGGQIAALVGSVGSGLEELLPLLTGQAHPSAGMIRLAGLKPAEDRDLLSSQIGVLFPDDALYIRQSVQENLRFYARLHALPGARISEVLEQIGLRDQAQVKVKDLSSSMARRLALGRAILHQPAALVLYDPFARCDNPTIALFGSILRQLAINDAAVLVLAPDNAHLDALCDVISTLENGRIAGSYQPADRLQDEQMPFMIPAKGEDTVVLLHPVDILYAVAQSNTAFVQTADQLLPTQFTLSELESKLSRSGFFRAHRSYLVNLQHVKEVIPYTRNSYSLKLRDVEETQIPLSKSAAKELRDLLGF